MEGGTSIDEAVGRQVGRGQTLPSLAMLVTEFGIYPEGSEEPLTAFKKRNDHDHI